MTWTLQSLNSRRLAVISATMWFKVGVARRFYWKIHGNLIELFEPTEHRDMAQMPDLTQLAKRVTDTVAGTKLLSTTTRTAARRAMFMAAFATLVLNRRSSNI